MLRRAAHGVGNWFQMDDVLHLKRAYGFTGEFRDPRIMARAAMLCTAHWEDGREGGLQAERRSDILQAAYRHSPHFDRAREWSHWFDRAFVHQLANHIKSCRSEQGISRRQVEEHLTKGCPRPWTPQMEAAVKRNFQKEVHSRMAAQSRYDAESRLRTNVKRFGILDRREAARSLQWLRHLAKTVPPRVWAATFGCIWNRWATSRRRQEVRSRCCFGCQWADDSIEHYATCGVVVSFARRRLHLLFRFSRHMQYWMLAAPEDQETKEESWWARLSLLHYAVLRTITAASRQPCALSGDQADRALWQATLEGAKGSRLLDAILTAA